MSKKTAKILFLSHSASRNGATILLLHLLRWLKRQTGYQMDVLVNGGGDLLGEFREIGTTRVWRNPARLLSPLPRNWRMRFEPRLESVFLKTVLRRQRYDLVHLNTVANWRHVPYLAQHQRNLLWHVHEMSYAIRLTMQQEAWRTHFPLARRFVAVSAAVRDALLREFEVPAAAVDLVHGFIPRNSLSKEEQQRRRQRIRKELGFSAQTFVVGGCGALGWRKGSDLFTQIARRFTRLHPGMPIGFLWVGGHPNEQEALEFQQDVRVLGLQSVCHLIPTTPDVLDYYQAMDVFALTSREDPFPLVMLEAGAAGVPTVCFADAGGGAEFVTGGAGLMSPYLDLEVFSAQLAELMKNPEQRMQLGAEAARRVRDTYTVENQAPQLLASMKRCLGD